MNTFSDGPLRVLPEEEAEACDTLRRLLYCGIDGIYLPTCFEIALVKKKHPSAQEPTQTPAVQGCGNGKGSGSDTVSAPAATDSVVVEKRLLVRYASPLYNLHTVLSPAAGMVPPLLERMAIALDILDTMAEAHAAGLAHGQLSSERMYVADAAAKVHIFDFFIGRGYSPYICPRDYRAPEALLRLPQADPMKGDVWAVGCLLFEALTTEPLFLLPSSRSGSGVAEPGRVRAQMQQIVDTVVGMMNTKKAGARGEGVFPSKVIDLFHSCRPQNRLANPNIPTPWAFAITECLSFNPVLRPALATVRDDLLRRIHINPQERQQRLEQISAIVAAAPKMSRLEDVAFAWQRRKKQNKRSEESS